MNGTSINNNLNAILGSKNAASDLPFSVGGSNENLSPEEFLKVLEASGEEGSGAMDEFLAKALKDDPKAREAFAKAIGKSDLSIEEALAAREQKVLSENPELRTLLRESKQGIEPDAKAVEEFAGRRNADAESLMKGLQNSGKQTSTQEKIDPSLKETKVIEENPRIPLDLQKSLQAANSKSGKIQNSQMKGLMNSGSSPIQTGTDFVSQLNASQTKQADILPFETRAENANGFLNKVKGYGKNQQTISRSMFDINPSTFNAGIKETDDLGNSIEVKAASGSSGDSSFDYLSSNIKRNAVESMDVIGPNTKVVDLLNIPASNKSELIQKITNYIEMNKFESSGSLDVLVKHDELGHFRVNASRAGVGNQVDLQITAASKEGHQSSQKMKWS